MARKVIVTISKATNPLLLNSQKILEYATEAVESLLRIYDAFTKTRGRGAPSTEEQDLLRALLVFAGAGLDAALKQLVQDALFAVVGKSEVAQEELTKFVERHLVRGSGETGTVPNFKEIAALLLAPNPRGAAMERWAREITGSSLQSYEELEKLIRFLGIKDLHLDKASLTTAFATRNRIVHEMDMDLHHPTRKRRARKRKELVTQATVLLETANNVVTKVDAMLA